MKAAQINKYGGDEVVEINPDAPMPELAPDKIIVKISAAGVNPIDWKIRKGNLSGMNLKFPLTLGGDFSGVIMELGENVTGFKIGDEIYGQAITLGGGSGSFAQFALAPGKSVALKPSNLTHTEAAALPLAGASALEAIHEHIHPKKDQKILIHGGAGGIGSFAVQMAKNSGAYVCSTARADDIEYVKDLGADEVIDYENQNFKDILHDYDAVFDTVGGKTYAKSFQILKNGGIIVSMLEQPNDSLAKEYGITAIAQNSRVTTERLIKLSELADRGVLKIHIDKTFPLDQAGAALGYLEKGKHKGKVVIAID